MQDIQNKPAKDQREDLRNALLQPMATLRNNLSKVPRSVLKTKYKQGYDALILKLRKAASEYATVLIFHDIQIPKKYQQECLGIINHMIESFGIKKTLSHAVFKTQDIVAFDCKALAFREKIIKELSVRCKDIVHVSDNRK